LAWPLHERRWAGRPGRESAVADGAGIGMPPERPHAALKGVRPVRARGRSGASNRRSTRRAGGPPSAAPPSIRAHRHALGNGIPQQDAASPASLASRMSVPMGSPRATGSSASVNGVRVHWHRSSWCRRVLCGSTHDSSHAPGSASGGIRHGAAGAGTVAARGVADAVDNAGGHRVRGHGSGLRSVVHGFPDSSRIWREQVLVLAGPASR